MNAEKAQKALTSLIETIESTGGLITHEDGTRGPVGEEDWLDLAEAYLEACDALGREPKIQH